MKITLSKIIEFNNLYNNKIKYIKLPLYNAYDLAKLYNILSPNITFYNNQLQLYINLFAKTDENGQYILNNGNIEIKQENIEECNEKLQELDNMEIDIKENYLLSLENFLEVELTAEEMSILLPFIKEKGGEGE